MAQSQLAATAAVSAGLAVTSIVTDQNGGIEIGFSFGNPTAPPGQSGTLVFASEAAMKEWILENAGMVSTAPGHLMLAMHLASNYIKQDGTLNNPNQVLNKELRYDPFAANILRTV